MNCENNGCLSNFHNLYILVFLFIIILLFLHVHFRFALLVHASVFNFFFSACCFRCLLVYAFRRLSFWENFVLFQLHLCQLASLTHLEYLFHNLLKTVFYITWPKMLWFHTMCCKIIWYMETLSHSVLLEP